MKRRVPLQAAIIIAGAIALSVSGAPASAVATQVTVADSADSYTSPNAPTTNYGGTSSLAVYAVPDITSLLRFVLPPAPAGQSLSTAVLRVHTDSLSSAGSVDAVNVRVATGAWTETGVDYANRPAVSGPVLGTLPGGTVPDTGYDIALNTAELTALLGTSATLALQGTGTDSLWLWSRQFSASLQPVLVLGFSSTAPPDTAPPSVPTGLVATAASSSVGLSWHASADNVGVTGYRVYRSNSAGFAASAATAIANTPGTTFTDSGLPAGTWYYRVAAFDAAGNISAASNAVSATIPKPPPPASVTVMAVGDIACASGTPVSSTTCRFPEVERTIAAAHPYRFLELGDMQYQDSTLAEIMAPGAYNDTFGALKPITLPTLGNHELFDSNTGYFDYFYGPGVNSGPFGARPDGYYTTMLGSWRFISLDSECGIGGVTGGCAVGSPQYVWLHNVLATNQAECTIAIEHRPRWSTGANGSYSSMAAIWDLMAADHVDVFLAGHNHMSEAFKPIGVSGSGATPTLAADGIRAFTVGTGGANLQGLTGTSDPLIPALVSRSDSAFGPLELTLGNGTYSWSFVPISGMTFTGNATTGAFSGTGTCH